MKTLIAAALASTFAFSGLATANQINFEGELTNATCSAAPGSGSGVTPGEWNINFGKVAFDDLADGDGTAHGGVRPINVVVTCADADGMSSVKATFDPLRGSGIDTNDRRLLSLASDSVAGGVGIGIIDAANRVIDLGGGDVISADLVPDATGGGASANLALRAAYVLNGAPTVAGVNTAQLPFTLTFE